MPQIYRRHGYSGVLPTTNKGLPQYFLSWQNPLSLNGFWMSSPNHTRGDIPQLAQCEAPPCKGWAPSAPTLQLVPIWFPKKHPTFSCHLTANPNPAAPLDSCVQMGDVHHSGAHTIDKWVRPATVTEQDDTSERELSAASTTCVRTVRHVSATSVKCDKPQLSSGHFLT